MKKRVLSALMVLCMVLTLLPVSAFAAPKSEDTVVRFYVEGTGSTKGYDVKNQPTTGGKTIDNLYVLPNFALLVNSNVMDSNASPNGTKVTGHNEVKQWLESSNADSPAALNNIQSLIQAINKVYSDYHVDTQLDVDAYNDFEYISAEWIGGGDDSYHVHIKLIRNVDVDKQLASVVRDGQPLSTEGLSNDTVLYAGDQVKWNIKVTNNTHDVHTYSIDEQLKYTKEIADESIEINAANNVELAGTDAVSAESTPQVTVNGQQSKMLTASYIVEDGYNNYQLENTVTVTNTKNAAQTATDSTSNRIGNDWTVTYNKNDGTQDAETNVVDKVYAPEATYSYQVAADAKGFTREGYKFTGWNTKQDGTGKDVTKEKVSLNNSVTYFAQWELDTREISVEFVNVSTGKTVEGGTETVTVSASNNTELKLSELTLPEGYVLSGNPDPYIVRPVDEKATVCVQQNRKITITYNITDLTQGHLTQAPEVTSYSETMTEQDSSNYSLEGVTPKAGYQFTGWRYNGEDSGILPADATLTDVLKHVYWDGAEGQITVSPVFERTDAIMNIRFVLADGTFVGGGDYFLPEGVQNLSILEQYVPVGYEMAETGEFMVTDGGSRDVRVEKLDDTVIMNIRFVLADGTFVGGGDYFLPKGVQNLSILEQYVPVGYEMAETGDFMVTDGGSRDVRVEKLDDTVIMNIRFVLADGTFVGGGDYFLPEGVQNLSILEQYVPVGYEMAETGDFMVTDGGSRDVRVEKLDDTVIMNIRFVLADGTFIAGGDYFLPEGIQNMSILEQYVPEGYKMMESGDFFVTDGGQEDITVEKIAEPDTQSVTVTYWDTTNDKQVGESFTVAVAADATNLNTSVLTNVPEGYELVWTGDLAIENGAVRVEVRPVTTPPVEKTFTVTFDSNGGSAVASQTVKEGEKAVKPANPTRSNYTFEGWFTDETLKNAYDFNTPVTGDITLYADWDRRSSGGGGGGGSTSTKKYTITVICGEGGEITPDGGSDNEVEVRKGNDQTFRISADNGYRISDVLVDGESVGSVDKYTFKDVDEDHEIEAIFARRAADPSDSGTDRYLNTEDHVQYMTGYPNGSFGPSQNMTRAEAAQMFYALLLDKNVAHTVSFSDVPADAWYAEAVNTLASLGMINGYPDGTFRPDAPITRAEFCVIALAFAYEPEDFDCDFRDVSTRDWFYDYVAQATSYGWISGSDRSFRPNECITRAEVSVIVNNMLGRVADEDYIDRHEDELNTFPDVKPSHWAYYSIMETANSHDYTKNNGNENWR